MYYCHALLQQKYRFIFNYATKHCFETDEKIFKWPNLKALKNEIILMIGKHIKFLKSLYFKFYASAFPYLQILKIEKISKIMLEYASNNEILKKIEK